MYIISLHISKNLDGHIRYLVAQLHQSFRTWFLVILQQDRCDLVAQPHPSFHRWFLVILQHGRCDLVAQLHQSLHRLKILQQQNTYHVSSGLVNLGQV